MNDFMHVFKVCTSKCMCVCACAFVYRPEVDVEYLLQCPSPYFETNLLSLSLWSCSSSTGRLACLELRKKCPIPDLFLGQRVSYPWMNVIHKVEVFNQHHRGALWNTHDYSNQWLFCCHGTYPPPCPGSSTPLPSRSAPKLSSFSSSHLSSLQSSGFAQRFCCSLLARTCLNSSGCSLRAFGEVAVTFSSWAVGVTNELIKVYLLKAVGILGWILEQKKRLSGKVSEIQIKSGV